MRINAIIIERSVVSASTGHWLEIPGCVLWCKQLETHYQDALCGWCYVVATAFHQSLRYLAPFLTCFVTLGQVISFHQTSVSVSIKWE